MKILKNRLLIFAIFLAALLALRFFVLKEYLTFEQVKKNSDALSGYAEDHYALSVLVFIGLFICIALFMPGTIPLTVAGGFVFGTAFGALYTLAGIICGSSIVFLSARYLVGNWVQRTYEKELKSFNEDIKRNGHLYLIILRISPVVPAFIINFLAGFTRITFFTFLWTTLLGVLPGTIVYTFTGRELKTLHSARDLFSARIMIPFLMLALFTVLPFLVLHRKRKG